ncbi:VOC family protein [Paenibacillus rhizoplanae]
MSVIGPDFISLQVSDLEGSAEFLSTLSWTRPFAGGPASCGGFFDTKPIAFALRDLMPGVELSRGTQPGLGVALWLYAPDTQDIHDKLAAAGVKITSAPIDGPFGRTFTFADPDGYLITLHSKG